MNAAVDSQLEALAFNPVNLGPLLTSAFNSLWAWLAVATAAFSFWRLRSSSAVIHQDPAPDPETTSSPSDYYSSSALIAVTTSLRNSAEKKEEEGVLTRGNSMKKRLFTVYYDQVNERENDEENEEDENNDVDGGDELVVLAVKRWGPPGKGLTAVMRETGDLGWYCYQDRNVIDGSVVRLWGEERESCGSSSSSSPRNYRRRCSVIGSTTPLVFT